MKNWALPATVIIFAQYVFAVLVQSTLRYHYERTALIYLDIGLQVAAVGLLIFIITKLITCLREHEIQPAKRLIRELPKSSSFVFGTLLVTMQMAVLTWTKIMLPMAVPFWAGPYLARFDQILFLGSQPWRVAESIFGWAGRVIDLAYITWLPIKFATLAFLFLMPESSRKSRLLLTYFLIVGFTAIGQYLLSSAGPIFFARLGFGDRYSQLPIEPWVAATSAYLWNQYQTMGSDVGAGISAMPSLHVAISLWIALVIREYFPRFAAIGFFYFATIVVGSVMLGWHFFADDLAATAIAMLSWSIAGRRWHLAASPRLFHTRVVADVASRLRTVGN